MMLSNMHYLLYRYLRFPIIDIGEGDAVSHLAIKTVEENLRIVRERSVKSICVDELDDRLITDLFPILADGGVICAVYVKPEAYKAIKSKYGYQVFNVAPFTVIKRLHKGIGEFPVPPVKPVNGRKKVLIVRYGAFGDQLMVTPLLQHYYDEGWHITYNCTYKGESLMKGDPRIDDLLVQEDDIIPKLVKNLDEYWKKLGNGFDKVILLSGTVEGDLLRVEGQPNYSDSYIKRNIECNGNYIDHHFDRAGLNIKGSLPSIWLSDKEREWAKAEVDMVRKRLKRRFIVLWNIFGSGWHKAYPWMFDVWMILKTNRDDIGILAVSDTMGKYVVGNEFTGLVHNGCGKYTIRQSLSLHSAVDAVVTPETWSLTAAQGFPAPMIALLSHSSKEKFTWRDGDIPMAPSVKDCPCYPCHQLHYTRIGCSRGAFNKDATLCMDSIIPADVYDALMILRSRHEYNTRAITG
jgi:hypothetical protein